MLEAHPDDVNYVIKHYPLPNHKFAYKGAMAALAAGNQGKFWEFHSQLLKNYKVVNEEKILEIAQGLGLNMAQFATDRTSSSLGQIIREDTMNGRSIGVRGTPAVFINGKRIDNRDLRNFAELIRRELGEKGPAQSKAEE